MPAAQRSVILAMNALVCTLFAACGPLAAPPLPTSTAQKSNLTPGMVKATIRVGATGQSEILAAFGAPNIITRDKAGKEVWTYDVQSVAYSSAESAGSAGIVGGLPPLVAAGTGSTKGAAVGQSTSSTFTLMIIFDDQDVVVDYRMMSSSF